MITLTADDSRLLKDVRLFVEPVEVYDTGGKLLGLFVPANLERAKEQYAKTAAKIDPAELARRRESKQKGATHDEIWGRIRELQAEMDRREAAGEPPLSSDEGMAYYRSLRARGVSRP